MPPRHAASQYHIWILGGESDWMHALRQCLQQANGALALFWPLLVLLHHKHLMPAPRKLCSMCMVRVQAPLSPLPCLPHIQIVSHTGKHCQHLNCC